MRKTERHPFGLPLFCAGRCCLRACFITVFVECFALFCVRKILLDTYLKCVFC